MGAKPLGDAGLSAYAQTLIRIKAQQLSRKPGFNRSDQEDLEQELAAHYLARQHLFDPRRGATSTFADRVLRSAVAIILRDRRRKKRAAGFRAKSLDVPTGGNDEGPLTFRDLISEVDLGRRLGTVSDYDQDAESAAAVAEAFQSLPPDLQELCQRLMNGSATAVARDMCVSRYWMRSAMERVRRHFQRHGLGDSRESTDASPTDGISKGQRARDASAGDVP